MNEKKEKLPMKIRVMEIFTKIMTGFMFFCVLSFGIWFISYLPEFHRTVNEPIKFIVLMGFFYLGFTYAGELITGGYFRGKSKGFKEGADMALGVINKVLDDEFKKSKGAKSHD